MNRAGVRREREAQEEFESEREKESECEREKEIMENPTQSLYRAMWSIVVMMCVVCQA